MDKFKGILMCTDLDGTLLSDDKSISKENIDAIEYFKSEGGAFTFVTGRMPFFAKSIYDTVVPNAPFVCINGGGIYDHVKCQYVWAQIMSRESLKLVDYVVERVEDVGVQINALDKIYFCKENLAQKVFREVTGVPNNVADYKNISVDFAKILFVDHREEALLKVAQLLAEHPLSKDFDFIRSEKTLYEILPKGVHKGYGMKKLAGILGIDINKTIALGDYNNDIEMLRNAKVGIAVANACPEAKAVADRITVSNNEHAIAKTVEELEKGLLGL
ncbi:MAG: HAD family phosphatase [Clostridia bacterium]|nr:HAD family phosphatase [Clostridia bacterium]